MQSVTSATSVATATRANDTTLFASLELSKSKWVVTINSPGSEKFSKHVVEGGDGACLLDLLSRSRAKAEQRYGVPWIPERSATRLREADVNILSKFGKQGLEWRLEPEAFAGREVGREGRPPGCPGRMCGRHRGGAAAIGVSVHWRFRRRLFAMRHKRRRTRSSCRA